MTATCSNCPFWQAAASTDPGGEYHPDDGWCHHASNTAKPDMNAEGWWCSEHPFHPARIHELAAMAMQGLLANSKSASVSDAYIVADAYDIARAMLAEAEKEGK